MKYRCFGFVKLIVVSSLVIVNGLLGQSILVDDFESGNLDQWTVGGRQQGVNLSEVISVDGSLVAHLHHEDFTEITLENEFTYSDDMTFSFDMDVAVASDADNQSTFYATAGVRFIFYDASDEVVGWVSYAKYTSELYPNNGNTSSSHVNEITTDGMQSYSVNMSSLLSQITLTGSPETLELVFSGYTTGWPYNMSGDVWLDNVVVNGDPPPPPPATFSDDFESGNLDQWTVGGRQQGVNLSEVISVDGSLVAHLHHEDFTEITLENEFTYSEDMTFNFDMDVAVASDADNQSTFYATAGVQFRFLDASDEIVGWVSYAEYTSELYPDNGNTASTHVNEITLDGMQSYSISMSSLLSQITLTGIPTTLVLRFSGYTTGWPYNMSGDVWLDNVVVNGQDIVDDGLVAYYPFNGNTNDESGNGYDGTNHNADLTSDRFGHQNSAYYLDGNQYITTGLTTELGTSFTYMGWGKALNSTNTKFIMRDSYSDGANRMNNSNLSDSVFTFSMVDTDDTWPLGGVQGRHSWIPDDNWHHIAVTINDVTKEMIGYFDGVPVETVLFTGSQVNTPGRTWKLGKRDNVEQYFRGYIDDIRFYNQVLSEERISDLFHEGGWMLDTTEEPELATGFILQQNYPNPFNPTTTIRYGLPDPSDLSIVIYDVTGREVATLVQTQQLAGWHTVKWNGKNASGALVSTGVYFARLQAGTHAEVIKMTYLR